MVFVTIKRMLLRKTATPRELDRICMLEDEWSANGLDYKDIC